MEIQKHTGEKLEDYFSRLVAEGFEFDASYQNITLADIESVLRRLKHCKYMVATHSTSIMQFCRKRTISLEPL